MRENNFLYPHTLPRRRQAIEGLIIINNLRVRLDVSRWQNDVSWWTAPPDSQWENWFLRGKWKFRVIFSHAPWPPNSPLPHNKVSSYEGNKVFYTASAVSTLLLFLIFPSSAQHTTQSTAFPNAFRGCLLMPWNMVNKSKNNSTRRSLYTLPSLRRFTHQHPKIKRGVLKDINSHTGARVH